MEILKIKESNNKYIYKIKKNKVENKILNLNINPIPTKNYEIINPIKNYDIINPIKNFNKTVDITEVYSKLLIEKEILRLEYI